MYKAKRTGETGDPWGRPVVTAIANSCVCVIFYSLSRYMQPEDSGALGQQAAAMYILFSPFLILGRHPSIQPRNPAALLELPLLLPPRPPSENKTQGKEIGKFCR